LAQAPKRLPAQLTGTRSVTSVDDFGALSMYLVLLGASTRRSR
jgi:hypothetical protein